jgi:hypothetical protein
MRNSDSNREHQHLSKLIELRVVLTNGDPTHDTKLKFTFTPAVSGIARVWLAKLPQLKNPDAFPRQFAAGLWELRLEVVGETAPLAVVNYTQENVCQWLSDIFAEEEPITTELLILAHDEQFTISIHQPSKGRGQQCE